MFTIRDLIAHIRRLIELQASLLEAFNKSFPEAKDTEFLLDAPRSGQVKIDGESWSFRQHGAGLSFQSADGVTIDAHKHLSVPEGVDAWRLLQYIESLGIEEASSTTERSLQRLLEVLKDEHELLPTEYGNLYQLAG